MLPTAPLTDFDRRPLIGLIGGAGPAATAYMHGRLIELAQRRGAAADTDFPAVLVWNAGFAAMTADGVANGARLALLDDLRDAAHRLTGAGVQLLVPACNTFELVHDELDAELDAPLLSLPRLAAAHAAQHGIRRVGVLSSDTARRHRLHEDALAARGVTAVTLTDAEQAHVTGLIATVMAGPADAFSRARLARLSEQLAARGADAVLIGCTELSVMAGELAAPVPVIDSAELALAAALDFNSQTTRTSDHARV